MSNFYVEIRCLNPFYRKFLYVDAPSYAADDLFVKYDVFPLFDNELSRPGDEFVLVVCRVRRREVHDFLTALSELPAKMRLIGHENYEEYCNNLASRLDAGGDITKQTEVSVNE